MFSEQEKRLERRTQHLLDELARTERKAAEMKSETERLRRIKEEAKAAVSRKHPNLFSDHYCDDYDDDKSLLSDSHLPPTFLSRDLAEIQQLLLNVGSGKTENVVEERLQNLRREADYGSAVSRRKEPWPRDCIPVPVETFKRLMAEASSSSVAHNISSESEIFFGDQNLRRHSVKNSISNGKKPMEPEVILQREAKSPNDDTSNDAADDDLTDESCIPNVPPPREHKRTVPQIEKEPSLSEIAIEQSNTQLQSRDSPQRESESEVAVNRVYRPPDPSTVQRKSASSSSSVTSHTSSSSAEAADQETPIKNPLANYYSKAKLNLGESETDSQGKIMREADEMVTGPEEEEEDDFWN